MLAKVTSNLYIGSFDSLSRVAHAIRQSDMGIANPIADITCVINVSPVMYDGSIPDTPIIQMSMPQDEPMDPDFEYARKSVEKVCDLICDMQRNEHVVLVVCETGRKQAPVIATYYQKQKGVKNAYDFMETIYMTPDEAEKFITTRNTLFANQYNVDFHIDEEEHAAYRELVSSKLCMSRQYKKMLAS